MKYIFEILYLASWPALIIASYYLILYALKKFDKKLNSGSNDTVTR